MAFQTDSNPIAAVDYPVRVLMHPKYPNFQPIVSPRTLMPVLNVATKVHLKTFQIHPKRCFKPPFLMVSWWGSVYNSSQVIAESQWCCGAEGVWGSNWMTEQGSCSGWIRAPGWRGKCEMRVGSISRCMTVRGPAVTVTTVVNESWFLGNFTQSWKVLSLFLPVVQAVDGRIVRLASV